MMNKHSFNHNYMMKYNDKQIQLEIKKEKYSKKIQELISKNYKNFDELIKSNSKLENFMNKFNHAMRLDDSNEKIYTFDLETKQDKEYINKCTVLFSEINSILDYVNSSIDAYDDRISEENYGEEEICLKLLKENTSNTKVYLQNLSKKINTDKFIESLFSEYMISNSKIVLDCEKKVDFNEKISDSNKDRLFLDMQNFLAKEKHLFYKINLSFEKDIFNMLNQSNRLVEILSNIKEIINSCKLAYNPHSFRQNIIIDSYVPKKIKKNYTNKAPLLNNNNKDNSKDSIHEEKQQSSSSLKINHTKYKSSSVTQSLYEPFTMKKYVKEISENFQEIKKNTVKNIKGNFFLSKKEGEIRKITNEMLLYNNPKINVDNLSKNTYNDIMKKVILNKKTLY